MNDTTQRSEPRSHLPTSQQPGSHSGSTDRGAATRRRALAAATALGLLLGACSGSEDDAGLFEGDDSAETIEISGDEEDAESGFAASTTTTPSGTADTATDTAIDTATAAEESEDAAGSAAVESDDAEGLFAPEPDPEPDPSRLEGNEFENYGYRSFVEVAVDPLSTFALDVDTGSWTVARRWLDEGQLPPVDSVRPEEWINAFDYDYEAPRTGLDLDIAGAPSPFDQENLLIRVGVQAQIVDAEDRPGAALTFVVDTSGSMDRDDRLGLVKESLGILVDELDDDDTVAIVTYDDRSGVVLEPTPASERDVILDAIDELRPGGSTNLEAGLAEGYRLAHDAFVDGGINRVVLASDGVANVGMTDPDDLVDRLRDDAEAGIDLVTVGFGMGNFNDVTMEQLADQGDGFYAYVDTIEEAERLFSDEVTSTLLTVARDAKIQVDFDDEVVEAYRLIGFENRGVRDSDFRNDDVDAGELGAGHQVTALYEIELVRGVSLDDGADLGEVALRWEDPEDGTVTEVREDIDPRLLTDVWADTDDDTRLATLVATFAEVSRDNDFAEGVDLEDLAVEIGRLADDLDRADVDALHRLVERAVDLS